MVAEAVKSRPGIEKLPEMRGGDRTTERSAGQHVARHEPSGRFQHLASSFPYSLTLVSVSLSVSPGWRMRALAGHGRVKL